MPDVFTKEQRSKLMSKIKSKDTKIELKMKKTLEDNGISFVYQPKIFGKPDFLIPPKIVIFCDSSFWHGRNWRKLKQQLKEGYWQEHIRKNKLRDKIVTKTLQNEGYVVIRFWDDKILKDISGCMKEIQNALSSSPAQT
jgi:DNA mismatch endonuclease, patch repair protein